MLSTTPHSLSDAGFRDGFHRRSLEHQRPLSTVTMAFTVVAFLTFVVMRSFVSGPTSPLVFRLACAVALALLVVALPRTNTPTQFGAIGVAYMMVLLGGVALNVVGVSDPLLWTLPAVIVIPVCAAPLWLTPVHFFIGTLIWYAAGLPLLLGEPHPRDVQIVSWMWAMIGVPTAAVFHFGFYWFRRGHYLLENQLTQLAATDPLTGLQNRRAFVEQAERRLDSLKSNARTSAIFVDIDHFKSLNDRFGHAMGDQALFQVAQVLMEQSAAHDSVSRIGGEEFAVLRPAGLADAVALAEQLRSAITTIARPDGFLSASFGVAEHRPGESILSLLDRADEALLRAKQSGRNRVCAERAMPVEIAPAPTGAQAVRQRWQDYYLVSHFQPLYSLSHQKQVGFEALLRGELADGSTVPPVVLFAPRLLSDEGALDRVSHAVHLANARRAIPDDAWLFLNILPATFVAHGYADELAMLVREAGLEPERVILEILESHGGSVDDMSRAAARYRELGFLIAVDDFGAGQSNLDRLFRIKPDLVKLDGELIRATSPGAQQPILPKLVSLLHQAGMLVVVEGVETTEELILAIESNVDFAQGYLLGRPSPEVTPPDSMHRQIDLAFDAIAQGRAQQHALFEMEVRPYRDALSAAANALMGGATMERAFATLAKLPRCVSCFILDDTGRQIGGEVAGVGYTERADSLYPVSDPRDARWDHRPYFRNAVLLPGVPVASNPYLSLASGRPCVAVTVAIQSGGQRSVLGTELDWSSPDLPWPASD
ncbi:bifunctional diguanylate cyclase/phosphodiesterase [Paraburkholderia sp.]|uniref:bifunctional diguanylate cyclase/phosphodiesterase n=1 Tax=Paraburkholderia sp. TaxID=1926495 RepID=UPI002395627C|nr:bifunctional diguanylate cyclase/phosphodiesterase [Paraburkholderia sp.]MDE1181078.1 bifunctional diguanylate cyclase/phosphodiesterase [Paraburkholderia sp.]